MCRYKFHSSKSFKYVLFCFVLQKVCVLQCPPDSVQKPLGPNNDVQKHDALAFFEVLPGCVFLWDVSNGIPGIYYCYYYLLNSFAILYRWWGAGAGGCGGEGSQANFTACKEDFG